MFAQYCVLDPLTLGNSFFARFETIKTTVNDLKTFEWKLSAVYSFYIGYLIFVQAELTIEIKEGAAVKSKIKIK